MKNELIWIVGIALLLYFISYGQIIRNFVSAPQNSLYIASDQFPVDMVGDLSIAMVGYHDSWTWEYNYSTYLAQKPTLLKLEYITIGHLARIVHTQLLTMYLITRFIVSVVYLTAIYLLIRSVFLTKFERILGFLFTLFAVGISYPQEKYSYVMNTIPDTLAFQRLTLAAHHYMLGGICFILSLILLSLALEKPWKHFSFFLSVLFAVLTAYFYGPNIVIVLASILFYILLCGLQIISEKKCISDIGPTLMMLIIFGGLSAIMLLYVRYEISTHWAALNTTRLEHLNPFHLSLFEYFKAVGLSYLLSFFALPQIFRSKKPILLLLAPWVILHPVAEYYFTPILSLNPIRFFLSPYFIPFGILGTIGIMTIARLLSQVMRKFSVSMIAILLCCIVLISGSYTYEQSILQYTMNYNLQSQQTFGYPLRSQFDAMNWLLHHTKPNQIVLTGEYGGTIIPAFAGNKILTSFWLGQIAPSFFPDLMMKIYRFYSFNMSDAEAAKFLQVTHISYVWYSTEEHWWGGENTSLKYPFLRQVFASSKTIIYQVVMHK